MSLLVNKVAIITSHLGISLATRSTKLSIFLPSCMEVANWMELQHHNTNIQEGVRGIEGVLLRYEVELGVSWFGRNSRKFLGVSFKSETKMNCPMQRYPCSQQLFCQYQETTINNLCANFFYLQQQKNRSNNQNLHTSFP